MSRGLQWFTPNKIVGSMDEVMEGLREFGVTFDVDQLNVRYGVVDDGGHERLMKSIGWTIVYDDGEVQCRMRGGVNGRDIRTLMGLAERIVMGLDTPGKAAGWSRASFKGRRRWVSTWSIEVDERSDPFAARIMADHHRSNNLGHGSAAVQALTLKVDAEG